MKKEAISKFYFKYKLIIYPVLVGVASTTLIILVIIPQIRGYFKGQEDTKATMSRINALEVKAAQLENLPAEDLKRQLQFAILALPSDKDYTFAIGVLQRVAATSGINLTSVNIDTGKGKEISGVSSFLVKVDMTTTQAGLDLFLENLEKAPLLMKVNSFSMDSNVGGSVNAALTINIYFSPTPKNLGGVESPIQELSPEEQKLAVELASNSPSVPASIITSTTQISPEQPPSTILPRGKVNPFE